MTQDFAVPENDWFVVGQGDVALGKSYSSGPARQVSGDTLAEGSYAIGRGAFYAKGIVDGDVKITASLDTGETLVKDLFSNLDRKEPRQLLRRLNSEQYYRPTAMTRRWSRTRRPRAGSICAPRRTRASSSSAISPRR